MILPKGAFPTIIGLICWAVLSPTLAQAPSAAIRSAQSSGVTVSISKVSLSQRQLVNQFMVSNNTNGRVYVMDVQDQMQAALTSTGTRLDNTTITGIEHCSSNLTNCLATPDVKDLNHYSYIEPGEFTVFGISYFLSNPVSEHESISFSVALIARYATPNSDPFEAGPPRTVRFNFPNVPLAQR